jgi:small subunit ribosomal protein S6
VTAAGTSHLVVVYSEAPRRKKAQWLAKPFTSAYSAALAVLPVSTFWILEQRINKYSLRTRKHSRAEYTERGAVYYETIFIVNPDVSQENTEQLTDALIQRIEKAGGRIVKREYWGSRPLAYQIAKRKRGHYVLLVTDGEPKAAAALEEGIRLDERIIRFLTTSLNELSDEPSPLMRRKTQSEESKPAEDTAEAAAPVAASAEATSKVEAKPEAKVEAAAETEAEVVAEEPAKEEAKAKTKAAKPAEGGKAAA